VTLLPITVTGHMLRLAAAVPVIGTSQWSQPLAVLYHGVQCHPGGTMLVDVFEQHIRFLKRQFTFVSANDDSPPRPSERRRLVLTFDDGFQNNADVVAPILRHHNVPATFFVCTRHATRGKYLWFSYLRGLERHFPGSTLKFRDVTFDMRAGRRQHSMRHLRELLLDLRPHPAAMYQAIDQELPRLEEFINASCLADTYAGMTVEHISGLAADPLFSVGAHTCDHPFLTRCDRAEMRRQVEENRAWIEATTGRPCDAIAYPAGEYNEELLGVCQDVGFARGYSVTSRFNHRSQLEIARMGVYSESTAVLGFKLRWGHLMRAAGLPVG
jgi:peptidoglycan/xylan/chitin deacetylase (PgdA/CDA1 family)